VNRPAHVPKRWHTQPGGAPSIAGAHATGAPMRRQFGKTKRWLASDVGDPLRGAGGERERAGPANAYARGHRGPSCHEDVRRTADELAVQADGSALPG
jgi:hypothetical protein